MEDLLRLLPRKIIAAVVVPFVVGVVILGLLVGPSPSGQAFIYMLFVGGVMIFVLLALGLTLLMKQDASLDSGAEGGR